VRAASPPAGNAATVKAVEARREQARVAPPTATPPARPSAVRAPGEPTPAVRSAISEPAALKAAFLSEVQKAKTFFYGTVIAQAHRIDVESDRIVIAFAPPQKAMRVQVDPVRSTLEEIATQVAGRRMSVIAIEIASADAESKPAPGSSGHDRQSQLKQQALADKSVQALLDVFGTEIKDVEER
jgi:hypothetical protein